MHEVGSIPNTPHNSCHSKKVGDHFGTTRTAFMALQCDFYWPSIFKDANEPKFVRVETFLSFDTRFSHCK